MGKYAFDIAVGFAPQVAAGTYNAALGSVVGAWGGQRVPGGADDDEGLLLGDSESGINGSGLTLSLGRSSREKGVVPGSFTRALSDFLKLESRSFTFAFPFVNHRANATTPVDSDFVPHLGLVAILEAVGLLGAASGGPGHDFAFDSAAIPVSALVIGSGQRVEFLDCVCSSLSIQYNSSEIAIATATLEVGSIREPQTSDLPITPVSLPTLNFGEQATVSAPVIELAGHAWGPTRGFSELTITITPDVETVPDSNLLGGDEKSIAGRTTTIEATLFKDDAAKEHELEQLLAAVSGDLDSLSFSIGNAAGAGQAVLGHTWNFPEPALDESAMEILGSKAADTISLVAGNTAPNAEAALSFV